MLIDSTEKRIIIPDYITQVAEAWTTKREGRGVVPVHCLCFVVK
jgi:hypothetical protein